MTTWAIYEGDCKEILPSLEANSVDAVVTDPPAGISFMGKKWDGDKGGRKQWIAWMTSVAEECLRVIKPGGHAFVWALPRTSHWTATAWEDAGFELRDCVYHVFGTGFPKSSNVGKAIDKAAGAEREVVGKQPWTNSKMVAGQGVSGLKQAGSFAGEYDGGRVDSLITAPATEAAKKWDGWGTALKPAVECWWLLRKPLAEKTVAANVLKWGTGALNIDECRVEGRERIDYGLTNSVRSMKNTYGKPNAKADFDGTKGRWPANLIHDGGDEVLDGFPDSSTTGVRRKPDREQQKVGATPFTRGKDAPEYTDSGSAARFFYCAKPSKKERGENNKHPTVKAVKLMRYLCKLVCPPNGAILDPFCGSGSTGVAAVMEDFSFIGIEQNPIDVDVAFERVDEVGIMQQNQIIRDD